MKKYQTEFKLEVGRRFLAGEDVAILATGLSNFCFEDALTQRRTLYPMPNRSLIPVIREHLLMAWQTAAIRVKCEELMAVPMANTIEMLGFNQSRPLVATDIPE